MTMSAPDAGQDSNAVVQVLLQQLESPQASMRMLCAFVTMHMAIEARSNSLPARHEPMQAVVKTVLHVLALPACTLTGSGIVPTADDLCSKTCTDMKPL